MKELTEISEEAVQRYFNTLAQFGYKNYSDVYKLITLLFIEEFLSSDSFSEFITEEDYRHIISALYCILGSTCLIEFPEFINYDTIFHKKK